MIKIYDGCPKDAGDGVVIGRHDPVRTKSENCITEPVERRIREVLTAKRARDPRDRVLSCLTDAADGNCLAANRLNFLVAGISGLHILTIMQCTGLSSSRLGPVLKGLILEGSVDLEMEEPISTDELVYRRAVYALSGDGVRGTGVNSVDFVPEVPVTLHTAQHS